jgi:hypothetical protein
MIPIQISNIQRDAIIHAVHRSRIPNSFFTEIMAVRVLCLGERNWIQVENTQMVSQPDATQEMQLTEGEINAIIGLAEIARQNSVLEGIFAIPLELLKISLISLLESHKPKDVKSQGSG